MFPPGPYPVQFVYKGNFQTSGVPLAFFADDTCLYATDRKEGYVLIRPHRNLTSMEL
jgi:hypothetical protein